ncbi:MAG: hypothetical protein Q9173_003974 [Seirophora scorigena]
MNVRPDLESPARDQARYVNGAIFYMQGFFADFYDRIHTVQAFPNTLNDILTTGFKLNPRESPTDSERISTPGVLIRQLSIPMTLGLSIANVTAWNDTKITAIAGLWSSAIRATPKVQQVLWGNNTAVNAQQQSLLFTITPNDTASSLLYQALALILSDIPTFLAFVGKGRFTTGNTPTIPRDLDIAAGVNTFVTSKLMQADGMYAVPGRIVEDIADAATAGENKDGAYYRSPSTRRQYELRSKGQTQIPLRTLLDNVLHRGWADPQLLFDGNYNCTASGWAGAGIVNDVGEFGGGDVSCLSQLPMYVEKGTPCPTDLVVGGRCPFGYLG